MSKQDKFSSPDRRLLKTKLIEIVSFRAKEITAVVLAQTEVIFTETQIKFLRSARPITSICQCLMVFLLTYEVLKILRRPNLSSLINRVKMGE